MSEEHDRLMRDLGISPESFSHLMNLNVLGIPLVEHENAEALAQRIDRVIPGFLIETFGSRDTALEVFSREIPLLNAALHKIRVARGRVEEIPASPVLIHTIARVSGVLVKPEDTLRSWALRVEERRPGLLNGLSKTSGGRDSCLRRSFPMFRHEVSRARARLIMSMLTVLAALATLVISRAWLMTDPVLERAVMGLLLIAILSAASMCMAAYRIRMIFARAEERPLII